MKKISFTSAMVRHQTSTGKVRHQRRSQRLNVVLLKIASAEGNWKGKV